MSADDIDTVREWRNRDHVKAYMFTDNDITKDKHKRWFNLTLLSDDVDYQIVEYLDKPIGLANAVKINKDSGNCYWGFYIGETNTPKGCGTILSFLMLDHLFNTHPIHTIYGEVFEFNAASLKLHEKFGFKTLLKLAHTVLKNGKDENIITLSLSRNDWDNIKINIYLRQ